MERRPRALRARVRPKHRPEWLESARRQSPIPRARGEGRLRVGRGADRTYLTGESMGGHVTLLGMQEFPTAFAGGLAMCPAGPELFDFYAAMSAAAEVISGVQFHADSVPQDLAKMSEA